MVYLGTINKGMVTYMEQSIAFINKEFYDLKPTLDTVFADTGIINLAALQLLLIDIKALFEDDKVRTPQQAACYMFQLSVEELVLRMTHPDYAIPLSSSQILQWKHDLNYKYNITKELLNQNEG